MDTRHLSRRRFLEMVGAAGGTTAVYHTGMAMGLLHDMGPVAQLDLQNADAGGESVVVLGAGLAGLSVAYELEQAGYDVTVLEAASRIGGRNMTLRHGDVIDEMGHKRVCNFDDDPDLYFNPGPARIAGHHSRVLRYCKKLGIPLQVKANFSRPGYVHDTGDWGGKPMRVSRFVTDTRGFISELLHKAVDQNRFDEPLSEEDQDRLRDLAKAYGDLDSGGRYRGSSRGGFLSGGHGNHPQNYPVLPFGELLDSDYWANGMLSSENPDWAEPLMEVTGGMDNISRALARNIRKPILMNAPVQSIQNTSSGIDVVYNHQGERRKISADWCFNSIPVHLMVGIPNNFATDYKAGLAALKPDNFFKIGLQMKERFWEREGIYGGITTTNQRINEVWYPSHDIHKQKGVVLGAYAFGSDEASFFERMTPEERIEFAGKCGDKVHEGYSSFIEAGVTVPWGRMNHMMGCGVLWTDELRQKYYERLQKPEGRHYMIGDQISYHPTWQESAFGSAENALIDFDKRVRAATAVSRKA